MSSSQNPFSHARNTARMASSSSSGSSPRGGGPFHNHGHWGGSPADLLDQPFTDEMRDRQARGKDPYAGDASDASDLSPERLGGRMGGHRAASSRQPKEPFTKIERRDWAETVLDNPELLMMYAQSSGATLPATRFRFKKIMCGLEEEDDDEDSVPEARGGDGDYQQRYHGHSQPVRSSSAQQQHQQHQQQQRGRDGGSGSGSGRP